ncbi:MAG: alkaline phosphatase D family protein [Sedimentisphaerales bacterium]
MKTASKTLTIALAMIALCVALHSSAQAAVLTHGPMIGHTTDTTTQIWVRTDGPCKMQVRLTSKDETIVSETIRLVLEDNFCGSAEVMGLSPKNTYSYRVILDNKEQPCPVKQEFTTFHRYGEKCIIRVGFGHSLRGEGTHSIWDAIGAKKPDLFILMGDNIYSDSTEPGKQRRMYLQFRADPHFRTFGATTPIYAVWDDHDYGADNSDRTQPGKERSLKTFNEIWPNPKSQAIHSPGIWSRFTVGCAEFFLMDVRYHRSPNDDPDGPEKTMLGAEQFDWLRKSLADSSAVFKFPVSGSSWNCGGPEAWNHTFTSEYDSLLAHIRAKRIEGIILLGGDQHMCKVAVRPRESWNGYDLHEWMAGQLWNGKADRRKGYFRAFGLITVNTEERPAKARLEFFDLNGRPHHGRRILYTELGALRALLDSPRGATDVSQENRRYIDRFRPGTSGPLWETLPVTTGETLTEQDLRWPQSK